MSGVSVRVAHRLSRVNAGKLREGARNAVSALGYADWSVDILLSGDFRLRRLNRDFRGVDATTDVLSFPHREAVSPGLLRIDQDGFDALDEPELKSLGDIVVSVPYVERWCAMRSSTTTVDTRLQELVVHGICHLVGYTHDTEEAFREMRAAERLILGYEIEYR